MIELLTPSEMAEADCLTIADGVAGIALMEQAGRAVADAVARHPLGTRVVVVAGLGNNGGDGFVAARILVQRGFPVRVVMFGDPGKLNGDAAQAAERWTGAVEAASPEALGGAGVIVDALFGAGLDGAARAMIEALTSASAPIITVDLPGGLSLAAALPDSRPGFVVTYLYLL